jgi:hypothetical protein
MKLKLTRTGYPLPDVAVGPMWKWHTLQHDFTPVGLYDLVPHVIHEGPLAGEDTYCLVNPELGVFAEPADAEGYMGTRPVRIAILVHQGNWPHNSLGCILIGMTKDTVDPAPSVGGSDIAFRQFMGMLGTGVTGHQLEIINESATAQ